MKLASISYYPVKSTSGHEVAAAEVQPWGLAGDRRYLVADERGAVLTARQEPRLLACVPVLDGGTLTLTGPHAAPLTVAPAITPAITPAIAPAVASTGAPTGAPAGALADVPAVELSTVRLPSTEVRLTDCGDAAAAWLSALVERPVRLMWLDDPTRRPVNPLYGHPDDRVSLADAFPLLLTTTASLARLNDWIAETARDLGEEPRALPMRRFRPNVVIDGVAEPFAEDEWKRVRIGEVEFRVTKGCDRCVLTTVDTTTYRKGKEPLRTLARHRKRDGKVWFGINLIPDLIPGTYGRIAQGDPVILL
ncbi:MOSC domain-containing protein [Nonomuraea sp. PA05]|uniref:MOSC domain-containing protein n=1 Tax=Nonomuraea sp. PA05 TaxID=2604466 RepID=UPI0011DAE344|nr:MOSC N-terminal beta barrel domain-containing protein [Nonomuraea sp. PA05]TYB68580.1 MOSC domain-containing protein [Nonomuraea sp. PA05]